MNQLAASQVDFSGLTRFVHITISSFIECKLNDKQIARFMDRIGNTASGLSRQAGKPGAIMNGHGADYRKAGKSHEIRLLVDDTETPGWILLGCRYQEATLGGSPVKADA